MEEVKKVNTLSDKGYVDSAKTMLARLLAYYILTDGEQSYCFRDQLLSLPKAYYEFINQPESFRDRIGRDVETLLNQYFETVSVEVDLRYNESESKADIALFAEVIDQFGRKVGLGKVATIDPTGLGNVIDINNFGEGKRLIRR